MTDQEQITRNIANRKKTNQTAALRTATIRVINDFLVLAITLFFTYENFDLTPIRFIILGIVILAATSLIGYTIIRRGSTIISCCPTPSSSISISSVSIAFRPRSDDSVPMAVTMAGSI